MGRVAKFERSEINPEITPEFRRRLASALPKKSTPQQVDTIEAALVRAYQLHFIFNQPEERRQTQRGELSSSLKQLRGHLVRSAKIVSEMNRRHEQLLDEAFYYANGNDDSLLGMYAEGSSGFSVMLHRLEAAVEFFQRDYLAPPPGKKGRDRTYVRPICHIAGEFMAAFPGAPMSGNQRVIFSNVVVLWFELIDVPKIDPGRHIKTALAELKDE